MEMWVTYEAEQEKIQCKKNYGHKVFGKENLIHQGTTYVKNYLLKRVMKHKSFGRETEHQTRAAAQACHSAPLYISAYLKHHCWIALELNSIIKLLSITARPTNYNAEMTVPYRSMQKVKKNYSNSVN
jgi:hypothetical protein